MTKQTTPATPLTADNATVTASGAAPVAKITLKWIDEALEMVANIRKNDANQV